LGGLALASPNAQRLPLDRLHHTLSAEFGHEPTLQRSRARLNCSKQLTVAPGDEFRVLLRSCTTAEFC